MVPVETKRSGEVVSGPQSHTSCPTPLVARRLQPVRNEAAINTILHYAWPPLLPGLADALDTVDGSLADGSPTNLEVSSSQKSLQRRGRGRRGYGVTSQRERCARITCLSLASSFSGSSSCSSSLWCSVENPATCMAGGEGPGEGCKVTSLYQCNLVQCTNMGRLGPIPVSSWPHSTHRVGCCSSNTCSLSYLENETAFLIPATPS